jgi:hypothetical protein
LLVLKGELNSLIAKLLAEKKWKMK